MKTQASAKQPPQSAAPPATFGFYSFFFYLADSRADAAAQKIDHAVIGGVVAVVVFAMLCLLIVLGRYFARHKGTPGAQFIVQSLYFSFFFYTHTLTHANTHKYIYIYNCFHMPLS